MEAEQTPEVPTKNETIPPVETATIPDQVPETQEQINWKKFREQREIERREADANKKLAVQKEAEAQALKAAMDALLNKSPQQQKPNETYYNDQEPNEDERIQKKVNEALAQREQIIEAQRKQREQAEYPQRLVQAHPDFNKICSADNLDYLEYHYPEVAKAFSQVPDGFDKWSNIYQAVKRFVPNPTDKRDQMKAQSNINKPQAMATPGVAQTGDTAPIQLDEARRAANWQRMQKVMKGV